MENYYRKIGRYMLLAQKYRRLFYSAKTLEMTKQFKRYLDFLDNKIYSLKQNLFRQPNERIIC